MAYHDQIGPCRFLFPPLTRTRLLGRLGLLRPSNRETDDRVQDLYSRHKGESSLQRRHGVLDESGQANEAGGEEHGGTPDGDGLGCVRVEDRYGRQCGPGLGVNARGRLTLCRGQGHGDGAPGARG